jgi:tetratricopeptide (TPR) repeat protein
MDHYLHRLPERTKFNVKYLYYVLNQQPDKAFAVVKMWVELYPDDLAGHEMLASLYSVRNMHNEAISEYKEIVRLDPGRYDVLSKLGNLYMADGKNDSALIYYQQYASMLPQEADSYIKLGNYYVMVGKFDLARENYENALAVADATEKEGIMISLGNVKRFSGEFEQAFEQYMDVLSVAKNAMDSIRVYNALQAFYFNKGQMKRSLETFELKVKKTRSLLSPMDFAIYCSFNIEPYIYAGELDKAVEILEDLAKDLEPPMDRLLSFGYMHIYAERGDTAMTMEAIAQAEELARDFGEVNLLANIYHAKAKLDERYGKYGEAIDNYNQVLEISATEYDIYTDISRCYRLMKEFGKAEEKIQIALKYRPFDAINNYEAGLLYLEMGNEQQARPYLQKAVDIWVDADSDHEKANAAREKLASI